MNAFATRAVHVGHDPAQHNGSVTTPIHQVSTFVRPHAQPSNPAVTEHGGRPLLRGIWPAACGCLLEVLTWSRRRGG
jgi:hypothetical protein